MKSILLTASILIMIALKATSQNNRAESSLYYLHLGAGTFSANKKTKGVSSNLGLAYIKNNYVYRLRYGYYDQWDCFGPSPNEKIHEYSALIGARFSGEVSSVALCTGLSFNSGLKKGKLIQDESYEGMLSIFSNKKYEKDYYFTVGIPAQIDFDLFICRNISIGFQLNGNVNPKRSYFAFLYSLKFGKFKSK